MSFPSGFSGTRPSVSPQELDELHGELLAALETLSPKASVIRLLAYLWGLPPVTTHPQTLYYRAEALTELCARCLDPVPPTSHLGLLEQVEALLQEALTTPVARHVAGLQHALGRLDVVRSVELAAQAMASGPDDPARQADTEEPTHPWGRANHLMASPEGRGILWPLHLRDPGEISGRGAILTVLTDGEGIPGEYREGYLASLVVTVRFRGRRGGRVVRGRDERGEEVVVGEELKGLVREALDRAVSLLGPGARDKARKAEAHVDVTLLAPGPVGEVHGRSLLLPLVVALTRAVAERLNLGATARWEAGIVWTGDVDDHGALHSVTGLAEKLTRVMASRCAGMAFPAADDERLRAALSGISRARPLALRPIAGLLDLTAGGGPGEIKPRSLAVRGVSVVKRASRPLGIAGTIAVTILLLALAYAAPRLSSWLDRMPTAAFVTADSSHIELRNSLNRKLRLLPIARTSLSWTVVNDIDDDGRPEFFYGTGCADSARGSIFCLDGHGKALWRFAGGPAADETLPYPLRNRFGADGVFAHDLDGQGGKEILAAFAHNPHYAGQLALLRRDGSYVSSFWHPGHLSIQLHPKHKELPLITDIDGDGYSEILFGATNNRLNQAVLVILDPRRIRGKGFEGPADPPDPQWQSYVVFPRLAELEEAMGSPRFHVGSLRIDELDGSPMICFGLWGMLPAVGRTNVFNYWLDFDLQVVRFYSGDPFKTWGAWALRKGLLDIDVCSKEFEDYMRQIEVIPGPAELLRP